MYFFYSFSSECCFALVVYPFGHIMINLYFHLSTVPVSVQFVTNILT